MGPSEAYSPAAVRCGQRFSFHSQEFAFRLSFLRAGVRYQGVQTLVCKEEAAVSIFCAARKCHPPLWFSPSSGEYQRRS